MPKVKILGKGILTKVVIVENCDISKKAKEKIEKAGGKIKK
jgi:ribosomal protein L15